MGGDNPLVVEIKLQIIFVELLYSNVAVFASAQKGVAFGVEYEGVDGTEVAFDASKLVLENHVEELGLEVAGGDGGLGDLEIILIIFGGNRRMEN